MSLASTLTRGLSFGKSRESPIRPYFQSAPTKSGFDIKRTWLVSGRQPSPLGHGRLQPHQISTLTSFLKLPPTTPLLSTRTAALGPPLSRPSDTLAPTTLCGAHTWFELRWIEELTTVIAEEIGPNLARLRTCPKYFLSSETKVILETLEPYRHLFVLPGTEAEESLKKAECHRATCSLCALTTCMACKLCLLLQNDLAVAALNICAKGRKKRYTPWPEACAWLDPVPGIDWEAKWKREGAVIVRDRRSARRWRMGQSKVDVRDSVVSGRSQALADAETEEFDEWTYEKATIEEETVQETTTDASSQYSRSKQGTSTPRKWSFYLDAEHDEYEQGRNRRVLSVLSTMPEKGKTEEADEKDKVRKAEAWAQSYEMLVGSRPKTEWYQPSHQDHPGPTESTRSTLREHDDHGRKKTNISSYQTCDRHGWKESTTKRQRTYDDFRQAESIRSSHRTRDGYGPRESTTPSYRTDTYGPSLISSYQRG